MAQPQERSDAGAKVVVACKLPAGIIIRGFAEKTEREAVLGGGTREFQVFRPNGHEHVINGTASPHGQFPRHRNKDGEWEPTQIVAGYALTYNVSKDLYDSWFDANRDSPIIKNRIVFAYEKADDTSSKAKAYEKVETGFEMVDPQAPGKKVRGIIKADVK